MELVFYLALILLIYFSYIDLITRKLDNLSIFFFFFVGLVYRLDEGNILSAVIGMILMGILSYTLWKKKGIGGADAKLLIALVPSLSFVGITNMLVTLIFFITEFAIISLFYFVALKLIYKKKKNIPLIPIITLTFIISWLFRVV